MNTIMHNARKLRRIRVADAWDPRYMVEMQRRWWESKAQDRWWTTM